MLTNDRGRASSPVSVVSALGYGVTLDEIVGVLVTLLPVVGPARVTAFAAATLEASSA
jgi:hypothetical protein